MLDKKKWYIGEKNKSLLVYNVYDCNSMSVAEKT